MSYGWGRVETLGALVNSVFLITVVLFIFLDALERFIEPKIIDRPPLVLIVGGIGLAVNLIGMFMFGGHAPQPGHNHSHGDDKKSDNEKEEKHKDSHTHSDHGHSHGKYGHSHGTSSAEHHSHSKDTHSHSHDDHGHSHGKHGHAHDTDNHIHETKPHEQVEHGHSHGNANMFGVFLHIFGDFLGSIGVMITAGLLMIFDSNTNRWVVYVDPIVSVLLSTIILFSIVPLVLSSAKILIQGVPKGVEIEEITKKIKTIPGVTDIHEFHVWQLVNSRHVSSVHVVCPREKFEEIAPKIQQIMHNEGVHSTTVQPEFDSPSGGCTLRCNVECEENWCCPSEPLLSTPLQDPVFEEIV
jgi:zinc transporter 1